MAQEFLKEIFETFSMKSQSVEILLKFCLAKPTGLQDAEVSLFLPGTAVMIWIHSWT